jgi:hypothetical protein
VRRLALAVLATVILASVVRGQNPSPAPGPGRARTPGTAKPAAAPINFSGVWKLDAEASRGVTSQMTGAVLQVRQNGNRIWIEPVEPKGRLTSEVIVVDGQRYEKALGAGQKGTVEAAWGKDGTSLWIEAVAGTESNPEAARQRMIWRLQDGGKTWTRQTRTLQPDGAKDTFLVFRRQEEPKK